MSDKNLQQRAQIDAVAFRDLYLATVGVGVA